MLRMGINAYNHFEPECCSLCCKYIQNFTFLYYEFLIFCYFILFFLCIFEDYAILILFSYLTYSAFRHFGD